MLFRSEEVSALMGLLEFYLKQELATFVRDRVRLRTIGRTDELPAGVQKVLRTTIEETKQFTDYTLVLALNYGARTEVVDAARAFPVLCEAETAELGRVMGRHVTRLATLAHGDEVCTAVIAPPILDGAAIHGRSEG